MHKAKWKAPDKSKNLIFGSTMYFTFISETDYNMVMLVEDLLEAGVNIEKIEYEEDADVGMQAYGGVLSADSFFRDYDWLRSKGMGGMSYTAYCKWNDIPFNAGMADDQYGNSHKRIVITTQSACFDINHLLRVLQKENK